MLDVDAVTKLALPVVREISPPESPEDRWEWLSSCWENVFCLMQKAALSFDEVNERLEQTTPYDASMGKNIPLFLGRLATTSVSLHEQRDSPEHREQTLKTLERIVADLCHALLANGQSVGWHPRYVGGLRGGMTPDMVLPALQLRGCLTSEKIQRCYLGALRGPQGIDETEYRQTMLTWIDEMEQVLQPWCELFNVEMPSVAVTSELSEVSQSTASVIGRLIKRVNRDVDCLVQGALAGQAELEISGVPMMFAAYRLREDASQMREMVDFFTDN